MNKSSNWREQTYEEQAEEQDKLVGAWIISAEPGAVKRNEAFRKNTKPKTLSWDRIFLRDDLDDDQKVDQGDGELKRVELEMDLETLFHHLKYRSQGYCYLNEMLGFEPKVNPRKKIKSKQRKYRVKKQLQSKLFSL